MFLLQAPEVRDLDVFTAMPEPFRRRERSDWADANRGGTITDSIGATQEAAAATDKIRVLTIAPLLAEAIRRIADESSVSSLFD